MFWIALATAIMMLSGEGDDTRAIAALLAGLRQAIAAHVPAEAERARALRAVTDFEQIFDKHRQDLQSFGSCVEACDRDYRANRASYDACAQPLEAARVTLGHALERVIEQYQAALTPAERARVAEVVLARPEAWILDPALAMPEDEPRAVESRPRGLEGVVSARHLTLPRNIVSIVFSPLGTTFAQRYPSALVDGGASYVRGQLAGSGAAASPDEWHAHLGVRFGLFDDLEAGAIFLPFELAPDFRFEPVSVFVTQQFRLGAFDLAARLSFLTPGDTGWALAPGVVLGTRGRQLGFQARLSVAAEVGTFREPRAPLVGMSLPLRVTWNLVPAFFVAAESGAAYDDLGTSDLFTVPLGFGAGYSLLIGSRVIDFTASLNWDHWLLPSEPGGLSAVQFGAFRVNAGASMSFQAL
ncbi:MAG TPA: hypothetical protein VJU61_06760 [Polyangiaceae bacterium]|nr:hypothetical protein [Polyangiaceae bacterium]